MTEFLLDVLNPYCSRPSEMALKSHLEAKPPAEINKSCGLVMPISAIDDCSEMHWTHVRSIIEEALTPSGFTVRLVSESDEVNIIHKNIILNVYQSSIIICDVSARNPNVMLELGMRLAFNKPVVIIKDDVTPYVFDTNIIEHIAYPRDLNYYGIERFKKQILQKTESTLEAADGQGHSGFLDNFGKFKVADLTVESVSSNELILDQLKILQQNIDALKPSRSGIKYYGGRPVTKLADVDAFLKYWIERNYKSTREFKEGFFHSQDNHSKLIDDLSQNFPDIPRDTLRLLTTDLMSPLYVESALSKRKNSNPDIMKGD